MIKGTLVGGGGYGVGEVGGELEFFSSLQGFTFLDPLKTGLVVVGNGLNAGLRFNSASPNLSANYKRLPMLLLFLITLPCYLQGNLERFRFWGRNFSGFIFFWL